MIYQSPKFRCGIFLEHFFLYACHFCWGFFTETFIVDPNGVKNGEVFIIYIKKNRIISLDFKAFDTFQSRYLYNQSPSLHKLRYQTSPQYSANLSIHSDPLFGIIGIVAFSYRLDRDGSRSSINCAHFFKASTKIRSSLYKFSLLLIRRRYNKTRTFASGQ